MDQEKIDTVRSFVKVLVDNTKREFQGQAGSPTKEKRTASKVLELVLGRRPNSEEISLVLSV